MSAAPVTSEFQPSAAATAMSPALRGFESNPFRVLRLRVNSTTSDAAFQAEMALTLARVNMSPDELDVLPWLAQPGTYEIQRAAQAVEEPFVRIKSQLLWFDLERDPDRTLLAKALQSPSGSALRQYLDGDRGLPDADEGTEAASDAEMAHAVNQANIRLLAAAVAGNGLLSQVRSGQDPSPKISKEMWKPLGAFRTLPRAHTLVQENPAASDFGVREHWERALQTWSALFVHPGFKTYIAACIADLRDDFISIDDLETIEESLRTHLADLSALEARFYLQAGRYPIAASLIEAISHSGLELRILAPALRPLRQVFQAEIAEMENLIDGPADQLAPVDAYLKRLDWIRMRWTALDSGGVVGLRDILDGAAERAYLRLRATDSTNKNLGPLLTKVKAIATAESLRERVGGYEKELEEMRTRVCHFCGGAPDYDRSVVLNGKKETHRERHFNRTTIHYLVRSAIVLRCARCARLHDYIRKVGNLVSLGVTPAVVVTIITILNSMGVFD